MTSVAPRRVLLVDDEPGLVLTVGDRLKHDGFVVGTAADGPSGIARATQEAWDVILLDVMLPGMDGFDVCRDLRRKGVTTPVIMLTAKGRTLDKVRGLTIGADDYLTKPFDMAELVARIDVQLRRHGAPDASSPNEYRFGDVVVDLRRAEIRRNRQPVSLAAREFLLLKYFIEHRARRSRAMNCSTKCGAISRCPRLEPSTCTWPGCGRRSSRAHDDRSSS